MWTKVNICYFSIKKYVVLTFANSLKRHLITISSHFGNLLIFIHKIQARILQHFVFAYISVRQCLLTSFSFNDQNIWFASLASYVIDGLWNNFIFLQEYFHPSINLRIAPPLRIPPPSFSWFSENDMQAFIIDPLT